MRYINKHGGHVDDAFELYDMIPIQITRVQAGTRRVTRNVPTDVEEPVFEWVQKEQAEPIEISRVQIGSRSVTRNVPTDVDEPVFEWVQQQSE